MRRIAAVFVCLLAIASAGSARIRAAETPARAAVAPDPLAADIERWSKLLAATAADDGILKDVKQFAGPLLAKSEQALRDGRRFLAMHRLAAVRPSLVAAAYVAELSPSQKSEMAAFETEWARFRSSLGGAHPTESAFRGLTPAAVRALTEATDYQVKITYEAGLDYGRSTEPVSGYFYVGSAKGQRDTAAFLRTLSPSTKTAGTPREPRLRALDAELDALERDVLAAYRPPLSIDRHPDFIGLSSAMKEARELTAAGLHHGALLRYLQAAQRFGMVRPAAAPPGRESLAASLQDLRKRLGSGGGDHSIGRIFLEAGEADLADTAGDARPAVAEAVVAGVLPRYFAALEPAGKVPQKPPARATITLVRWPYT